MREKHNAEFIPFDEEDCFAAIQKYGLSLALWTNFWNFMKRQSERGAPIEYVERCCEILEEVWKSKKEKE